MKLPDDVWQVIREYLLKYRGVNVPDKMRDILESIADIELFDGGAFIAIKNEFDLFVVPEKRGKWRIRSTISDYLDRMGEKYGTLVVKIYEGNTPSLRLAKHFGFVEVSRNNAMVLLEKIHG